MVFWLYRLRDGYCVRRSRKISIQYWPFVKLSKNRNEYFMISGAGHSDEGNRPMVQTAMPPRWIRFRIDTNFYCEISRVRGLIFLTPLQRISTNPILLGNPFLSNIGPSIKCFYISNTMQLIPT